MKDIIKQLKELSTIFREVEAVEIRKNEEARKKQEIYNPYVKSKIQVAQAILIDLKQSLKQVEQDTINKCIEALPKIKGGGIYDNCIKEICYDCYKNFKHWKRINHIRCKSEVYITHPTVTKEELDNWIKENKKEVGWGAEEWKPENWSKFKIWVDSTNFD